MAKTFVAGDIHGAYRALRQCLDRSHFDYEKDHLICLGDVCDGWPETKNCIDELLKLSRLTYILGNHDVMAMQWMTDGTASEAWLMQGGEATRQSYSKGVPPTHLAFLQKASPFLIENDRLFVHAGFDPDRPLEAQTIDTFLWDRMLAKKALKAHSQGSTEILTTYREVYIGHTPIPFLKPVLSGGVWLMDTGAGWSGVLSLMDIDSKALIVSDPVPTLYPGVPGRVSKLY